MSDELTYYQKLQWRLLLNVHYHELAEQFYKRLYKGIGVVSAIGSASAFVGLLANFKCLALIISFLIAFASALDWFFDFRGKASKHNELRVKNISLQQKHQMLDVAIDGIGYNLFMVDILELDKIEEPSNSFFYKKAEEIANAIVLDIN